MKDELVIATKRQDVLEDDPEGQDGNVRVVKRDPQVGELEIKQVRAAVDHHDVRFFLRLVNLQFVDNYQTLNLQPKWENGYFSTALISTMIPVEKNSVATNGDSIDYKAYYPSTSHN